MLPLPPGIDSVKGEDTVCLGRVYTYTAYSDTMGATYTWQALGGSVSPASGSSAVSVVWTAGSGMKLLVSRVNTAPPYCQGPTDAINVMQEVIDPNITGDTPACANAFRIYNSNYTRGEVYHWSVYPNTAGSVVSGDHAPVATVLWNNVASPATAYVILEVQKCDSTVYDTLRTTIDTDALIGLAASSSPACPGVAVLFTANAGDSAYSWNFGDGSATVTTLTNTTSHVFGQNITTGNINYAVSVTAIQGSSFGCPPVGAASIEMPILPGPVAYASSASLPNACDYEITGTITDNITVAIAAWYNSAGVGVQVGNTYSGSGGGSFYFYVQATNGCAATSNEVSLSVQRRGQRQRGGYRRRQQQLGLRYAYAYFFRPLYYFT